SPSLFVTGTISTPPDKRPIPEGQGFLATALTLSFWNLSEMSLDGWGASNEGTLSLERHADSGGIAFAFRSEDGNFSGVSRAVMIDGISFGTSSETTERGTRLFSHRNVWNSCLLLARAKGFTLRMIGRPDERGGMSECRWQATKAGVELTGYTPIEL